MPPAKPSCCPSRSVVTSTHPDFPRWPRSSWPVGHATERSPSGSECAPVANVPEGAGYFVSQERRTERSDGTVYAYVWAGWQAPGACFAVRLVIDQRLGEEATTNRAAAYLAALEEGLRPYQLAAHLPEVESVSDEVRSQLPLAEGSSGAAVAALQELLNGAGISVGDSGVDGSYGRDTAIAVAPHSAPRWPRGHGERPTRRARRGNRRCDR